jgi:hypothetical protein
MDARHPEDLERLGRSVATGVGPEAAQRLGVGVWLGWCQDIEKEGRHPPDRYLAAFLRGFSAPLDGWLPEGMAEYLAERWERPKAHQPRKGGRPPARAGERHRKFRDALHLARTALLYGVAEATERTGVHAVDVKKALHHHRSAALDSLEVDLLNTRYPLPEEEEKLARETLTRQGRNPPPVLPVASD